MISQPRWWLYGSQSTTLIPAARSFSFAIRKARVMGGWGRTHLVWKMSMTHWLWLILDSPIIPHNSNGHIPRRGHSLPGHRYQGCLIIPGFLVQHCLLEQLQILN